MDSSATARKRPLLIALTFEGAIGLAALIAAVALGIRLRPLLSLSGKDLATALLGVLALSVIFVVVAFSRWSPFARIRRQLDRVLPQLFDRASVAALFAVSAVAGISEELLFRGVLQHGLDSVMTTWAAVLIANLVFAALHLITPTYGVIAFFMGLILSAVFMITGSIAAAAITHGIYDFMALVFYLRRRSDSRNEGRGTQHTRRHLE